ncbi:MAG TPA: GNAT family N-acetyltransferase [Actinophytocola sp.]|uniref:GNAT family N-acetyltransferase n=1 Tax=Actinophytocola sp. TaxID=1872138 RepID=UPI002DBD3C16|nr:GNAT family N-acetyltransferase [Actinophytocola sp.]HEU5473219.1 GNAT family N-acetyltransferase [Actinophytocola sp.]
MAYPDDCPTLTDGVVTLRPYSLDDLEPCVEHCSDPESLAWTTIPSPYGVDEGIEWITRQVPRFWAEGSGLEFAIEAEHADGVRRFAGGVTLRPRPDGIAEIGFAVHPGARRRGVVTRAITLLVDWGFAERGVEVVIWFAYVGNWGSRRAVWRCGFSFDGRVEKLLPQHGIRRDTWVASLRATDTREPKGTWLVAPVLETDRLRLRPLADTDADRLFETNHDTRTVHFGGRVPGVRQRDGAASIARAREQMAAGQMINWCIADRTTDRLVGHIQLFDLGGLDPTEAKPGYSIHPDSRGRGYLTEALRALSTWTFLPLNEGGLAKRRLTISTAASNAASRHAATQAGYTHIGTNPNAFPITDTHFDDEVFYQLLNPTWQPPQTPVP